jgi:hypothetical protein
MDTPSPRPLRLATAAAVLVLLAALAVSALYPVDVRTNRAAYEELVSLTLVCCGDGDHWGTVSDQPYAASVTGRRAELMQSLGIDNVHFYPGNGTYPGAVVYLTRDVLGPIEGVFAYSVDGGPKRLTSCYTSRPIGGRWYRGHSLGCVFGRAGR